jgi:hypothetical protein
MNKRSLLRILILAIGWTGFHLFTSCTSYRHIGNQTRTFEFSGLTWAVKESTEKVGPGPNIFGAGSDQVWIDGQGLLHLKIKRINGRWQCAEVYTLQRFGPGKFSFYLASRVDQLDPNVVLGLFTWHDLPLNHHQEIDIEVSKWGRPGDPNAQFVVQPHSLSTNIHRYDLSLNGDFSTHEFTVGREFVFFESYHGHHDKSTTSGNISNWLYHSPKRTKIRNAQIHINLWLNKGLPPLNQNEAEIIIKKVDFVPLSELQS